jgi:hypothetical protein
MHLTDEGSARSIEADHHSTDQLPTAEDAIRAMEPSTPSDGGKWQPAPAPCVTDRGRLDLATMGHLAPSAMWCPRRPRST